MQDAFKAQVDKAMKTIIRETLEAGGSMKDVVEVLESVIVNCWGACFYASGDGAQLDWFLNGVREGLDQYRQIEVMPSAPRSLN